MEINGKTYVGIPEITQQIKDKNSCPPVAIRIIGCCHTYYRSSNFK